MMPLAIVDHRVLLVATLKPANVGITHIGASGSVAQIFFIGMWELSGCAATAWLMPRIILALH